MAQRQGFRARPIDVNVSLAIVRDADALDQDQSVAREVTHAHKNLDKNNEAVRPNPPPRALCTRQYAFSIVQLSARFFSHVSGLSVEVTTPLRMGRSQTRMSAPNGPVFRAPARYTLSLL